MIRAIILGFTAVAIFLASAAFCAGLIPPASNGTPVYALKSHSKPYYLKGKILKDCFDDAVECSLVVW